MRWQVLAFEEAPLHLREQHKAARARHFQNQNGTRGMENKAPTTKQVPLPLMQRNAGAFDLLLMQCRGLRLRLVVDALQLGYLKSLGCPTMPQTMMAASLLIERYKKM